MSVLPTQADEIIENKEQLVKYHASGAKPKNGFLIGTEHEKFVLDSKTKKVVPYEGPNGIKALLTGMMRFGFEPVMEGQTLIGLLRDRESISLEPAGQYELSGAPLSNLHEMSNELDKHISESTIIAKELGLQFMPIGYHPTASVDELPWMPKGRYKIMRNYMPKVGTRGLEMMQLTCTTQANLDFLDEADMARKMRVSLALQPVVAAIFANSPFAKGKLSGHLTNRYSVWADVDNARCGILPCSFENGFGFERYVDYALDVPMYFVYRDGKYIDCAGQSFRDFMAGKLPALMGEKPQMFDYINHLSTLFPDVRLKTYIEMRGADVGNTAMIKALPALWVGLLYDETAFNQAEALVKDWTTEQILETRRDVPRLGMSVIISKQNLFAIAKQIVNLAVQGLRRRAIRHEGLADEARYLEPLLTLVDIEQTEAERLMSLYNNQWDENIAPVWDAVTL
jgi:glutamate--cysteine ligase